MKRPLKLNTPLVRLALAFAVFLALAPAQAQGISVATLDEVPDDMVQSYDADAGIGPGEEVIEVDLGEELGRDAPAPTVAAAAPHGIAPQGTAMRAARAARGEATQTRRPPARSAERDAGVERAVFERGPIQVPLPLERERLITLPAPAALHVPADMAQVARIEVIDRTIYATALVPFTPIRIVAELIDSGQQIPMDFVADAQTAGATAELEVFTVEPAGARAAAAASVESGAEASAPSPKAPDMVDLTRHAARALYAPRRLAWAHPGVKQVPVLDDAVAGLVRGADVEAAPLGQWRGGNLYVTAVRVTNRSPYPLEIPLDNLRGQWLAATAQHGRIGAAGSETDTTAVYLVCAREFSACLQR